LTSLTEHLAQRIQQEGKITFRDWMAEALYHPTLGYYNRSDLQRWGPKGDYRTSPERSDLFAATFARYFLTLRKQLDSDLTIVEIGGGNGKFALGVLSAVERSAPELLNSTNYFFVETGHDACARASIELERFSSVVHFSNLDALQPVEKGIVFSNELLDAFPVHRITSSGGTLKEFYVTCDEQCNFAWSIDEISSEVVLEFCREHLPPLREDQIVEVNPAIAEWMKNINTLLRTGFLITIDYGTEAEDLYSDPNRQAGTLRGYSRHQFVENILQTPGENDLTTTIDWTVVKSEGLKYGFEVEEFSQLDNFLMQKGVIDELELSLAAAASEAERSQITTTAREMILPTGMAASFQVLVQTRD